MGAERAGWAQGSALGFMEGTEYEAESQQPDVHTRMARGLSLSTTEACSRLLSKPSELFPEFRPGPPETPANEDVCIVSNRAVLDPVAICQVTGRFTRFESPVQDAA